MKTDTDLIGQALAEIASLFRYFRLADGWTWAQTLPPPEGVSARVFFRDASLMLLCVSPEQRQEALAAFSRERPKRTDLLEKIRKALGCG